MAKRKAGAITLLVWEFAAETVHCRAVAANPKPHASAPRPAALAGWLALAILVHYWCLFHGLAAFGLTGPDEPRFAAIAREMAATGDWITPRLHGQPWFEKPILYYWAAAVQYKLWGDSEVAARLPSALAATVTSLALSWLAWRLYGWCAAQISLVLFPTTVAVIGFGRAASTDMLFSASLALSLVAAARVVNPAGAHSGSDAEVLPEGHAAPPRREARRRRLLWHCTFGVALGLATLAKGPAALALAGGSASLWMLATRRWRDGFALAHPLAILIFALAALPWYVLCALRNPGFVDVFLISHNVQRFLTPVFQHEQPFWFFGPILLLGLLPWTLLLIPVFRDAVALIRDRRWMTSPSFFIACWVVFPVVFFSISKSKLPGYVLPAIPPLTLLLARSLSKAIGERDSLGRWLSASLGMVLLILGGVAAAPSLAAARMQGVTAESLWSLAAVLLLGGVVGLLLVARGRLMLTVAVSALSIASAAGVLTRSVLPQMDLHISARTAALLLKKHLEQETGSVSVHQVHRAWHYGLNYYLRTDIPEWSPQQSTMFMLTSEEGLDDLRSRGLRLEIIDRESPKAIVTIRRDSDRPNVP